MKKLFTGRYQLVSIEQPKFNPAQRSRGRPKGEMKFKKTPQKSSRRDTSAFEYQEGPRKIGRPRNKVVETEKVSSLNFNFCLFSISDF